MYVFLTELMQAGLFVFKPCPVHHLYTVLVLKVFFSEPELLWRQKESHRLSQQAN